MEIELTQGRKAIIDKDDYHKVKGYKWYFNSNGYARATRNYKRFYLHRIITGANKNEQVDHINRNKLDNRRKNLRICTQSENMHNARLQSNNTSGYKGIDWMKDTKRWRARLKVNGVTLNLGIFTDKKNAYKARISYANKLGYKLIT